MKILIIGLGYAGTRYLRAFSLSNQEAVTFAYVDKRQVNKELIYFNNVRDALAVYKPAIIIVTVNDEFHAEILNQLCDFRGFVICEKPLCNIKDNLGFLSKNLNQISGFCLDLIERYSEATLALKSCINEQRLTLLRAHFYWGKDRINDPRPTCGVISEVIHALDIIQFITGTTNQYQLNNVIGSCSDFSISGTHVLDSVALTAHLNDAVVTGYSSFVNITRKREIDLTFISPEKKLIYATLVFDTPEWDIDYLKIWERNAKGDKIIRELHTNTNNPDSTLHTIRKLRHQVEDVIHFVKNKCKPSQEFPDLATAISLQELLNSIQKHIKPIGPVRYVQGEIREFFIEESDLERMG